MTGAELIKFKWSVDKEKLNKNDLIKIKFKEIKNLINDLLEDDNFSQGKVTSTYLAFFKEFLINYKEYDSKTIDKFTKDFAKIIKCKVIVYDERSDDDVYDEDYYFFTKGKNIVHNKCLVVNRYTKNISIRSGYIKYFSIYNNSNEDFNVLYNW